MSFLGIEYPAQVSKCSGHWRTLVGHFAVVLMIVLADNVVFVDQSCAAETLPESNRSESLTYRRVFVPADDADAWPLDGQKFIPIDARELETLIASANRNGGEATAHATIVEATYAGRIIGDGIVAGRGTWRIELHGELPSILSLGDIPLKIRDPRWRDEPDRPARVGHWGRSGGQPEKLGLEVARAGLVDFAWQVALHNRAGQAENGWRLPPSASSRLTLDLPPTHRPFVEGGIILTENAPVDDAEPDSKLRRWELVVGGSANSKLRIISSSRDRSEKASDIHLRDEVAYRLDSRGLNIVATWRFEGAVSQPRELVVPLSNEVQFISAEANGQQLAWQVSAHSADETPGVVIDLSHLESHDNVAVTIRAWHPLPMPGTWRMPQIRPERMHWIGGTIELSLSPMLELVQLRPVDCVQTGVVQSQNDGTGAETHWFTAYSPTAGLEISANRREPRISARLSSTISVSEAEIDGNLTSLLDISRGSVHKLTGTLAKGWIVESVETDPDDSIGEWIVNRRDGATEIEIQLAKSANPKRAVTVRVDGRLQPASYAEPITSETLRTVRWHGIDVAEHLLSFQSVEPYAAEPTRDLPAARAEIADAAAFDLTNAPASAALRIVLERGEFEADITLDATILGDEARLFYQLLVKPVESRIDRVLVYATLPMGDDLRWMDAESGTRLSAERMATTDVQRDGFPSDGQLWLVQLSQPTSRPVKVVATQSIKLPGRQQVPLLCLPRAVEQQGRIHVSGEATGLPILEQTRLQPIPAPLADDDVPGTSASPLVSGAYRYNPVDCPDPARCPRIWLTQRTSSANDKLVARQAQIESYFSANGRAAHTAIYHLMATNQVELVLPDGAQSATASLDGRPLPSTHSQRTPERISLRVPKQLGPATLTIQFESRQPALSTGAKLQPPLVENFAILSGEWTVWLPAQFEAASNNPWQADEKRNWRRRLFGPLGRPSASDSFDPLRIASGDLLAPVAADPTDSVFSTSSLPGASSMAGPSAAAAPVNDDGILDGWRAYRTTFVAQSPEPFVVATLPSTTALAVTFFLIGVVVGGWIVSRNRELFVALAATIAGLAVILPAPFAPLATGALLGLLFSLVARRHTVLENEDSPTKTWSRVSATSATAIAITILFTATAPAQPPMRNLFSESIPSQQVTDQNSDVDVGESRSTSTLHRVLVPADAHGHAVGSKHYIDEVFLRKLYELAGDDHAAQDWLIFEAACEGELIERGEPSTIVAGTWKLILDIDVLARGTSIVLPLGRDEASWQSEASLDGLPVAVQWNPDGQSCVIKIAEPGRYTLSIPFTPAIQRTGNHNRIDLSIPAFSGGRFQLRHPTEITGLELTGVVTTTQTADSPNSFDGELNGSGRISGRWLQQPETEGESPGLRATEMQWLHVGQDRVELYVKFIVEGGVQRPEAISVAIDGPWKLLASENVISDLPSEAGDGRTIRVALPADDIDRQEVLLRLESDDALPLGEIVLPRVIMETLPVAQRWIALSADPELACEFVGAGDANVGSVDGFQARWGEALETEDMTAVLTNSAANRATSISVRPRPAAPSITETLHVTAGSEGLILQLEAEVDPRGSAQFQSSLFVSEEVHIDDVTLTQAGQEVPVRWSRAEGNIVGVFFGEGESDPYRLSVHGHVPVSRSGTYKVPRIALDMNAAGQRVQFYREDDVLLEMRGVGQATDQHNAGIELPSASPRIRVAGGYQLGPSLFAAGELVVRPNTVRAAGQTLTSVEHDSDAWWATFICRFAVEHGEMGILQMRAPATWALPLELQSEMPAVVEQTELDGEHRQVTVRFTDAIRTGKEISVRLRGRLTAEDTSLIAVPDIVLETEFHGQHYVVVPASVDSQTTAWTEQGVQPAQLPRELSELHSGAPGGTVFEITSRPMRMLLQPLSVDAAPATIRLADTLVTIGQFDGRLYVTRMVVISRGLTECQLEVPPGQQMVQVLSEGRPTFTRRLDERHWLVPLAVANLPQFLEIVTRSSETVAGEAGEIELVRPVLFDDGRPVPVEVSLWTVGIPSREVALNFDGAALVAAAEQAALRLDRLTSIVESSTRSAIDLPLADGKSWYLPWAQRLSAFRQTSLETIRQTSGGDASVLQVQSAAEEQLTDAAERVETWLEQCDQIWSVEQAPSASGAAERTELSNWDIAASTAKDWSYCVAEGDAARLVVIGLPSPIQHSQSQLAGLIAIFAIAASAVAVMCWPMGKEFVCRWPHAIAFLAGIAYWAFLWPSAVGLLISAASVWLALRPGWPGRSMHVEGSTVISKEHGARSKEQGVRD